MKKEFTFVTQNDAKYRNGRISLLTIVILSAINLVSIATIGVYYVFSAYIPLLTVSIGYELYMQSDLFAYYICAVVIAAMLIVPYLLCYIFSKKNKGWMIAALALFSVDSALFLIDFVSFVADGNFSMILDLVIRVVAIVSLILGVKYGLKVEKESNPEETDVYFAADDNADSLEEEVLPDRTVTVLRKKSFVGCAALYVCYVNGKQVVTIKNGNTESFRAPSNAFTLGVMIANGLGSTEISVPSGSEDVSYTIMTKTGFAATNIKIVPTETVKK